MAGGKAAPRGGRGATYEAMLWTVILGELVVNCLAGVGIAVDGVPRRVLKAGRSSLEFIGRSGGFGAGGR